MERLREHHKHSGTFWAYVLIIVGIIWILKKSGWEINLPGIGEVFAGFGHFFGNIVHFPSGGVIPVLIILAGIILIAGRRFFGALLLVLLFLIILPHFLFIPGVLLVIFFPVFLIIIGIIILTKIF